MPSIPIFPPSQSRSAEGGEGSSLPNLLQTPSGLAIVELQGTIHAPSPSKSGEDVDNVDGWNHSQDTEIGKLVFPLYSASNPSSDVAWMKRVYLYVGKHQRLTGEVKKLPKAMAVVRRKEAEDEQLEIVEIVRHKIVFSQRPEPVGDDSKGEAV